MLEEKIIYISKEGLDKAIKEHEYLKTTKIPEIAARIDDAKQLGDLSENAEYHAAKEDMAWARGRLLDMKYIIDHALIADEKSEGGKIVIGSTVIVKVKNQTRTYTIVGAQEANPLEGKVSNESPLGSMFLGRIAGDTVQVSTPAGQADYEIIEVK